MVCRILCFTLDLWAYQDCRNAFTDRLNKMKKTTAILLFFCCNALFIFFEVHKQGQFLKLSYEIQKLQGKITTLTKEQNELRYQLNILQQPDLIAKIAGEKLEMKGIELSNVHSV